VKVTYLTRKDPDDSIKWLYEVHLKQEDTHIHNFAILYDSEDAPQKVELYKSEDPTYRELAKPDLVVTFYGG